LEFELADLNGEIKNLQDNQENYANTILKDKEKYILLKIERKFIKFLFFKIYIFLILNKKFWYLGKGADIKPFYTPLLTSEALVTQDFLLRINSLKKQKTVNQNKIVKNKNTPLAQTKGRKSVVNTNSISISELDNSID
jgi:hypothetical protein